MTTTDLDGTHDPELRSWVDGADADGGDFPVQNLPFGRFRAGASGQDEGDGAAGGDGGWRIGVAIGAQVLDLRAAGLVDHGDMNRLMAAPAAERRALRRALSEGLRRGSAHEKTWRTALHAADAVTLGVPCRIGDYTDFYVGIHHATAVGRLFRPDAPLLPNYRWVPIGYHGRASTVIASGRPFRRPRGQTRRGDEMPALGPSQRLDYELELGLFIGRGNALGEPIAIERAEEHLFGVALFNDWSARDIQAWEYQPLGPFLSKSFASTVSPWIVTLEALAPFRRPFGRGAEEPQPLPYLDAEGNRAAGAIDIALEVRLQTRRMREQGLPGHAIARSNYAEAAYWTAAQLVAHHTVNGCALNPGDLLGSGTLSGPRPEQAGSLLELTQGGKQPIALPGGETRLFLEDGDRVMFAGRCEREGFRGIGFGPCEATVEPAPGAG